MAREQVEQVAPLHRQVVGQAVEDVQLVAEVELRAHVEPVAAQDEAPHAETALAQLEHEGLVERVKGKGTFVSRPRTSESLVHTLVGLYDDVERRGGHVHSDVLRHEQTVADELWEHAGVAVRGGFHCAPLVHTHYGTRATGMVRFSPGHDTSGAEIDAALAAVAAIAEAG